MKTETYIGVGSNLGDKLANCRKAIDLTGDIDGCEVTGKSDFFRTSPVGNKRQDWYVNGVFCLDVHISPHLLLEKLLGIEARLGRERKEKWGPRTIDLDILLFGQDIIQEKDLTVPHPFMHLRKFVLVPMVQLVPDLIHPLLNKTMRELLETLEEDQAVFPMEEA